MKDTLVKKSLFVLMTLLMGSLVAEAKPDMVKMKGQVLYSFQPDYYLIQTDKLVYKIKKDLLDKKTQDHFEAASVQGFTVKGDFPSAAIAMAWPSDKSLALVGGSNFKRYNRVVHGIREKQGSVNIAGQLAMSFNKDEWLLQIGNEMYLVKKDKLDLDQLKVLMNANIGEEVRLQLPKEAVSFAWRYENRKTRSIASEPVDNDEVIYSKNRMMLRGRVLYSFDVPMVLVQSKDIIYQIRKDKVASRSLASVEVPGSQVELTVPYEGINFIWSAAASGDILVKSHQGP